MAQLESNLRKLCEKRSRACFPLFSHSDQADWTAAVEWDGCLFTMRAEKLLTEPPALLLKKKKKKRGQQRKSYLELQVTTRKPPNWLHASFLLDFKSFTLDLEEIWAWTSLHSDCKLGLACTQSVSSPFIYESDISTQCTHAWMFSEQEVGYA